MLFVKNTKISENLLGSIQKSIIFALRLKKEER